MLTKTCLRGRAKIRLLPATDGQCYFKLVAANGETMAVSETYARRRDALRGALRFQQLVAAATVFE